MALRPDPPLYAAWAVLAVYGALSMCAYPALDDWAYAVAGRDQGALAATAGYLQGWGGRWLAALLLFALGCLPGLAVCYPLLVLAGMALTCWAVRLGVGWRASALACAPLLAWLPSPAEGPYWLSGGITYLLPAPLLVLAALLPAGRAACAGRMVLGALAAGCSETAAVVAAVATIVLALVDGRRHLWTLAGIGLSSLVVFAAPGNAARWQQVGGADRPSLLMAAWLAAPDTAWQLAAMAWRTLLQPVVPALVLAACAVAPRRMAQPGLAGAVAALTLGGAGAALLASNAAIGFIEGRQANAIWLALALGLSAAAWLALADARSGWRRRGLALWLALACAAQAVATPSDVLGLLLAVAASALACLLAWRTWHGPPAAAAALALAALAAPGFHRACADLLHAPLRRAEQWRRDADIARLVEQGERRVRVPLADPRHFPATIAVGDLQTGHWATAAYAAWHGLDAVIVDPRCRAAEAIPGASP